MSMIFTSISLMVMLQFSMPGNQEIQTKGFTLDELPEYVVIRSEGIKESMGKTILLRIDSRRSKFEKSLISLEDYLSNKNKRAVNGQSDLLTAMSDVGFDYVNAYPVGTEDIVNVVFRKKEEFRK